MSIGGPKIPQVLEKILQLKEIRQEQLIDPAGQCSSNQMKTANFDNSEVTLNNFLEEKENKLWCESI